MTVYLDVLFLTNFMCDYINLRLCAILLGTKPKPLKLFAASLLGGIYGACVFVPYFAHAYSPAAIAAMAAVLVWICFSPRRLPELVRATGAFLFINLALGGAVYVISQRVVGAIDYFAITGGVLTVFACVKAVCSAVKRTSVGRRKLVFCYNARIAKADALCDSGNLLTTPILGEPVIICKSSVFEELLGRSVSEESICDSVEDKDLRKIPYKTVGGEGIMTGIRVDKVLDGKKCYENCVIGLAPSEINEQAIINSKILV